MKRASISLIALVLALGTIGFTVAAPAPRTNVQASRYTATADYCADSEEQAFLTLINTYRAQNGVGQLAMSQTLGAAAEHHSVDMAATNSGSHTLSDGTSWLQNIANHGYTYSTYLGENIAAGYSSASSVFNAWKNSSGHNANMLNANYKVIGIGRDPTFGLYWTTDFGGYVDGAAVLCGQTASSTPTSAPTTPPTSTSTPLPTSTPTSLPTSTPTPLPTSTPTKTPTPPPTSTPTSVPTTAPTATPATVTDYVASMNSTATSRRGKTTITTKVTIKDSKGRSVSGAVVKMTMTCPDGSTQALSATTNSKGSASVAVRATAGSGTYSTSVGDVSAAGYVYDPSANIVSSASVKV